VVEAEHHVAELLRLGTDLAAFLDEFLAARVGEREVLAVGLVGALDALGDAPSSNL